MTSRNSDATDADRQRFDKSKATTIVDYLLISSVVGIVSTELYFTRPQRQFITCEIPWRTSDWAASSKGFCFLYLSVCLSVRLPVGLCPPSNTVTLSVCVVSTLGHVPEESSRSGRSVSVFVCSSSYDCRPKFSILQFCRSKWSGGHMLSPCQILSSVFTSICRLVYLCQLHYPYYNSSPLRKDNISKR